MSRQPQHSFLGDPGFQIAVRGPEPCILHPAPTRSTWLDSSVRNLSSKIARLPEAQLQTHHHSAKRCRVRSPHRLSTPAATFCNLPTLKPTGPSAGLSFFPASENARCI